MGQRAPVPQNQNDYQKCDLMHDPMAYIGFWFLKNAKKMKENSDDFGLRSAVIQNTF